VRGHLSRVRFDRQPDRTSRPHNDDTDHCPRDHGCYLSSCSWGVAAAAPTSTLAPRQSGRSHTALVWAICALVVRADEDTIRREWLTASLFVSVAGSENTAWTVDTFGCQHLGGMTRRPSTASPRVLPQSWLLEVVAAERVKEEERGQFGVSRVGTVVFVAGLCNRLAGMPDPPWRAVVDESARVGFTLGMLEAQQGETAAGSSSPRFVVARQRLRRSASDFAHPGELTATRYAFDCGYWLARAETADVDSLLEVVPGRDQ
jgi:hypothetical protein